MRWVGFFELRPTLQSTVNELLGAGFDANEVKLNSKEAAPIERTDVRRSGARDFFAELFGEADDDAELTHYADAVRQGNYVVTAIASTGDRSDLATEVMSHHHPIELDERSSSVRVFHDVYESPVEEDVGQTRRVMTDDAWRTHWEQNYAREGGRYEDLAPGYEFGSSAASNDLFKDRRWDDIEPELKSDWEKKYPESKWERFKESVKHAFGMTD